MRGATEMPGGHRLTGGLAAAVMALGSLAGCSQAPEYRPPALSVTPTAFREAGPWVPAAPAGPGSTTEWWQGFGDPLLDQLEARIGTDNPTLAAALARHDQAQADVREARAALFPTIDAGADLTANRQSDTRPLRGAGQPDL